MKHIEANPLQGRRHLPCRLGPVRLAFDVSRLRSIHRCDLVQRNPSSEGPAGWLLEHDVPVIDLGRWLGLEGSPGLKSSERVLVFDGAPAPTGLLVDESGMARDVQQGDLYPLPPVLENLSRFGFTGIWVAEGRPWLVLDPTVPNTEGVVPESRGTLETQVASPALDFEAGSSSGGRLLLFSTRQGEGLERPVRFGLSITQILEVAALPDLDPAPGCSDDVRGLTVWRGEPLVVVDVDRRMGWSSGEDAGDRLLVAQTVEGTRLGLVACGAPRLLQLPVPHRPGDLSFVDPRVLGVFELEQETVIFPDLCRLAGGR